MAVTFIKKAPVQSTAPGGTAPLTERQTQALVDQGILPPPPKKGGLTIIHKSASPTARPVPVLSEGDRVRVTNDLYPWVTYWNVGDCGTVVRSVSKTNGTPDERKRYSVVEVRMDTPRPPEHRECCMFHAWELELLPKSPAK